MVDRSLFMRLAGSAALAALAIASTAALGSTPTRGPYLCNIGFSFFFLNLNTATDCTTAMVASPVKPCSYTSEAGTDFVIFTSAEQPELKIYRMKFVPAGRRGSGPKMEGPGLEAFFEPLEGPPQSRGWCSGINR